MNAKFKIKELKDKEGNVFFEMGYDPETNIGYSNWVGFIPVEHVMEGGIEMLSLIKKCNIQFWLNDNRQIDGAWDQANEWIDNWWMPKIIEAGLRRFGTILPEDDLPAELSNKYMSQNAAKTSLMVYYSKSEKEIEEWLSVAV